VKIVASAGHYEYGPCADGTAAHEVAGLVISDVWPTPDVDDVYDLDEADAAKAYAAAVPGGPDIDPLWEHVVAWEGDEDAVRAGLRVLVDQISQRPSGDDDTFDYWPSGVRYARAIAEAVGMLDEVDDAVRAVLATMGELADELADKTGVEVK
jgi:hypothetical protein